MDRYGNDFGWDRWGGGESGRQGGRSGGRGGEYGGFRGERGGMEEGFGRGWQGGGGRGWENQYDAEYDAWEGESRGGYGGDYRGFGGSTGRGYGGSQFGRGQGGYGGGAGGQRFGGGGERMGGGRMFGRGQGGGGGYGGSTFESDYGGYQDYGDDQGGYGGGWSTQRGGSQEETDRIRASQIMTEDPATVTPDTSLPDAAKKMRDLDVGIIPVVESTESSKLQGVITDRDIAIRAVAEGRDAAKTKVSDVMTTEVETCNKNDPIRQVMEVMQREQVRRVPITDREGRLVGIVAQADLAVDLMGERPRSKREVATTLRRVSQPGEPNRAPAGMQASQGGKGGGRAAKQRGEE
jgi:CBS domain-containing protein